MFSQLLELHEVKRTGPHFWNQLLVLQDVELLDEVLPASVPLDPQVSLVLAPDLSVLVRQEELLQPLLLLLLLAWQPPLLPGSLPSPHPQRPSWLRRN